MKKETPYYSEALLSKGEAARFLAISEATVNNWVRHGFLEEKEGRFSRDDLRILRNRIESGDMDRLNRRANKSRGSRSFLPEEYFRFRSSMEIVSDLAGSVRSADCDTASALFLLSCNLFLKSGDLNPVKTGDLSPPFASSCRRRGVAEHLDTWFRALPDGQLHGGGTLAHHLVSTELPDESDLLGLVYQSLLRDGEKSILGSYYTPPDIVAELLRQCGVDAAPQKGKRYLDPCCGTGQFLIAASSFIPDPSGIVGCDIDPVAVFVSRTNLLLRFASEDFLPKVYHIDALSDCSGFEGFFDCIVTNPPWGARDSDTLNRRKQEDSFALFIRQAYRFLKENGTMAFVLPEACANIRKHRKIREFILNTTRIEGVDLLGRCFRNVMSRVMTLRLKKAPQPNSAIPVRSGEGSYPVDQRRFSENKYCIFDLYVNEQDRRIMNRIENMESFSLRGNAEWALGIVTGDNGKYLFGTREVAGGAEPVFRGTEVDPFRLKEPVCFLCFDRNLFQQTAPEKMYRAAEKLIYRFISDRLVFAYDGSGSLTLNSANIMIPKVSGYPVLTILGLLNSRVMNFYFRKKFNPLRILRGDIEEIPLPLLDDRQKEIIADLSEAAVQGADVQDPLNDFLYGVYGFSRADIACIEKIGGGGPLSP